MDSISPKEVQAIVLKAAFQFAVAGLIVAALMLMLLSGSAEAIFLVILFPVSFLVALLGLAASIALMSNLFSLPLHQRKISPIVVGLAMPLLALAVAAFLGSLPEYIKYSVQYRSEVFDYIGKPFFMVMAFGGIPALVLGLFLGLVIRDRLPKKDRQMSK